MSWCAFPGQIIGNEAIANYGCRMFDGLAVTLQLVVVSVSLGFGLGLALALARLFGGRILSGFAHAVMTFFRGTPLLCQVFLVYYGAGQFRPFLQDIGLWALFRDAFFCAAFTFTLNTGAYQAEILRGAIASLPKGQWEGAAALGLGRAATVLRVVLPQALMVALRPLGNEVVIMVKSSSVASLVTVFDLMGTTRFAFARSFDLSVYLFAAVLYLVVVELIRRLWELMEQRLTRHLQRS